ncbi:diphosphomevalonate decarboxylase [Lentzea jiangxiensis]|uniref:diphosphomevalonate decarboxylase n=1 Tax=Lentzea jiangxiensis TaxID=641025 RepID=A0A1H0WDR4_9PSEU|nr:diphosphomevalonate decarboxylase [Lentzea jiangxiensis]SDP88681.1 diphosphomevalonate decarboxylase [Lentzea jiangxiensis]
MNGETRATAVAHVNVALVKYWGKRDAELVIPWTSSLSMTLDAFYTTTSVRFVAEPGDDEVVLNGAPVTGVPRQRVTAFLDLVRTRTGRTGKALVDSENTVPTGAGLASSSSGFAALALAASSACGVELDATALSRLARRGSGSASRSVFGGFALWHAGHDDESSYAEPVESPGFDPVMVVALVDTAHKSVNSRDAMRRTVETSPLFRPWADSAPADLKEMRAAVERADLDAVGEITERNALGMHATMLAARPAVRYFAPATVSALDAVLALRRAGISAYATMDAGPNVKVLCRRADADAVAEAVHAAAGCPTAVAGAGPAARLLVAP